MIMKFFIDFEATQFSDRIISIGCTCENGEKFKSFVALCKGDKLTNFITELTGITKEDLADAPNADEAFKDLRDWTLRCCGEALPQFYCYGNTDVKFLQSTIKKMSDIESVIFAHSLCSMIVDYAPFVTQYLATNGAVALKRVFAIVNEASVEQKHDALEDAEMLKIVFEQLQDKCAPGDHEKLPPATPKKVPVAKGKIDKVPDYVHDWCTKKGSKPFTVDTFATEENYLFKVTRKHTGEVKYFNDLNVAAFWLIRFFGVHRSIKSIKDFEEIKKIIISGKDKYGMTWEIK